MAAQRDQVTGPVLPREARGAHFKSLDRLFTVILAASFVVHSGFYVALARTHPATEVTLEEIPDRYARVIVPERLPRPPGPPPAAEKAPEPPPAPAPQKQDAADERRAETPEQVARRKAVRSAAVARAVQSKGLLKVLGALGPGAAAGGSIADVFGSGGRIGDVASALSGAGGVAIATDPRAGPRRGGGDAAAASIGQLATTGGGKVGLGAKTEVRVAGHVSAEAADVDSSEVDQGKLGAFVRARMGLIKACYENALKRNPGLTGRVSIRFTILETGALVDVVAAQSSLAAGDVAACITSTMRGWRTPFRPSGPVTVEYPFVFQPVN